MKILVDAHIFDHSFQGTSTYLMGLYNAMVKIPNVEITLCAHNIEELKKHFKDPRFKFVPLQSNSKWKRLLFEIPRITKQTTYDYAHFQYITPAFKHTKFITTIHDILFLDFKHYFPASYRIVKGTLFKWSAKRSEILLTVSNYSKQAIQKHYHIAGEKIYITPNAINENIEANTNAFRKLPANYMLFVSRFEPRKNHLGLLNTFVDLKLFEKGHELVFVGGKKESIERDTFEIVEQSIPKEHKGKVHFIENVCAEELAWIYKNCSCFVYPSFAEGFGIPPLEAAMASCKVVCSNTTAMSDFTFFKYRFDPNKEREFKNILQTAMDDTNYPAKEIKAKVQEIFNWDTIALGFYNHLNQRFG